MAPARAHCRRLPPAAAGRPAPGAARGAVGAIEAFQICSTRFPPTQPVRRFPHGKAHPRSTAQGRRMVIRRRTAGAGKGTHPVRQGRCPRRSRRQAPKVEGAAGFMLAGQRDAREPADSQYRQNRAVHGQAGVGSGLRHGPVVIGAFSARGDEHQSAHGRTARQDDESRLPKMMEFHHDGRVRRPYRGHTGTGSPAPPP